MKAELLGGAAAFFAQEYRWPRGTGSSTRRRRATPITGMCAWIGVGRAGFYEWASRPVSATASRREELKLLIAHVFTDSDGTYGYRRVHAALTRMGVQVGPRAGPPPSCACST
jgi:hypothetical protein